MIFFWIGLCIFMLVLGFMFGIYSKLIFKNTIDKWVATELTTVNKSINVLLQEADRQCKQMVQQAHIEIYAMQEHAHNVKTDQPLN